MKHLYEIFSYINVMLIGSYITAQFKFNYRVEWHHWLITTLLFFMWVWLYHREVAKEQRMDKLGDLYYDAECHVFKARLASTDTIVWQYFYTEEDTGNNKHSEYYFSKKEAVEAYVKRASSRRGAEPRDYNE